MSDTFAWFTTAARDSAALLLLDTVLKATVLLIVAYLAAALLHRASAAVRHRVWCLAFSGLLLLPVLSSLLPGWRAPIRPDRVSDKGEHRFTYSLFTHSGNWRNGGVVEAALDLNWPLRALPGRRGISTGPALTIDAPALSVQALKLAEDGSGDVIIRLVELYGSRGTATLQTGFAIKSAAVCDLLERPLSDIPLTEATTITLDYSPYQIQTTDRHRLGP